MACLGQNRGKRGPCVDQSCATQRLEGVFAGHEQPTALPALSYAGAARESRSTEGRSQPRFPIALDVQYKFTKNGIEHRGTGRTLDISSGGLLFEADEVLDAIDFRRKQAIELAINWPYLLDQKCALKLVIRGRFVRCEARRIAVTIEQYKFRTAGLIFQTSIPESAARTK
jgi:PilZ domain